MSVAYLAQTAGLLVDAVHDLRLEGVDVPCLVSHGERGRGAFPNELLVCWLPQKQTETS